MEIEDSEKLFTSLMNQVQEAQTKLKYNIEEKFRKSRDKDKAVIGELQEEVAELQRKHSELEELSQSDDHLHLLQVSGDSLICHFDTVHLQIFPGPKLQLKIRRKEEIK